MTCRATPRAGPAAAGRHLPAAPGRRGGAAPSIERLQGVDRVETLVANTYRGAYLRTIGRTGEHLAACLRVAAAGAGVPGRAAWGFDRFDEQAAASSGPTPRAQVRAAALADDLPAHGRR